MITTIKLVTISIISHSYLFMHREQLKSTLFANSTVLLSTVTMYLGIVGLQNLLILHL